MRKIVYIIFFLVLPYSVKGQNIEDKRWFSQAEVNVTVPNKDKSIYSFNTKTANMKGNEDIVLKTKVIYSTDFSMNYLLF